MRKLVFLLGLCLLCPVFSGCSNQMSNASEAQNGSSIGTEVAAPKKTVQAVSLDKTAILPGLKSIVDRGVLRVGMIQREVEAFVETQKDGSLKGIDVTLAQDLAKALGVSLEINREIGLYDELTKLLANDQVDLIISSYSMTPERASYVNLSKSYLTSRMGVMLNKQQLVKNQIEKNPIEYMQNNKLKIAAVKNSSHVALASELFPKAEILEMDSYEQMYKAVRDNKIFGYLCGELRFLCNYYADEELSLHTQVFVFSDALDHYCVGVNPNNDDLLNFVNSYIDSAKTITVKEVEDNLKQKA